MRFRTALVIGLLALGGALWSLPEPTAEAIGKWGKRLAAAGAAGDVDAVRAIIGKIVEEGEASDAEDLLDALPFIPAEDVLDDIMGAFRSFGTDKLDPVFLDYIDKRKDRDPIGCSCIFRFAEDEPSEKAEGWILAGLDGTASVTVRNALSAAVKLKSKRAIPKMIQRLEELDPKKHRFIVNEIEDALWELTAQEFDSVEDWKNFWEINKDSLDPKEVWKDNEDKKTSVRKRKRDNDSPEFFGVEILSSNVMFIIDMSGSMRLWDPAKGEGGSEAGWRERVRMERAKGQLIKAINGLKKSSKFGVLAYSDRQLKFPEKPKGDVIQIVPAAAGNKKQATKWASALQAQGLTHTDEAMQRAFKNKQIDTIMLLTDGAPAKRNQQDFRALTQQILQDVARMNKIRKVKIFTFGFEGPGKLPPNEPAQGQGGAGLPPEVIDFLKKLAGDNGGTYTPID
ncbi:MAG: VWA domain-containing protein [Planctomycetes bacterium]|nr:VWA domain-containing protein [Planctomycetota bacterium]